jgi:hypothetical protein
VAARPSHGPGIAAWPPQNGQGWEKHDRHYSRLDAFSVPLSTILFYSIILFSFLMVYFQDSNFNVPLNSYLYSSFLMNFPCELSKPSDLCPLDVGEQ